MYNVHWYSSNAGRNYPLDDTATGIDDAGLRLPNNLLVDLRLSWPLSLGRYAFLGGIAVTPHLVTLVLQAASDLNDIYSFSLLATLSVPQPVIQGKAYDLVAKAPGVGGWAVLGDGVAESVLYRGRFSKPGQGLLTPHAALAYQDPPVRGLQLIGSDQLLDGLVKFSASSPLQFSYETREINNILRQCIVLRLTESESVSVSGDSLFRQFAGPCAGRVESDNCGNPEPIEFINSVPPDCNGVLTLEFEGAVHVSPLIAPGTKDAIGIVVNVGTGLSDICPPKPLPSSAGLLPEPPPAQGYVEDAHGPPADLESVLRVANRTTNPPHSNFGFTGQGQAIEIIWDPIPGAGGYRIWRQTISHPWSVTGVAQNVGSGWELLGAVPSSVSQFTDYGQPPVSGFLPPLSDWESNFLSAYVNDLHPDISLVSDTESTLPLADYEYGVTAIRFFTAIGGSASGSQSNYEQLDILSIADMTSLDATQLLTHPAYWRLTEDASDIWWAKPYVGQLLSVSDDLLSAAGLTAMQPGLVLQSFHSQAFQKPSCAAFTNLLSCVSKQLIVDFKIIGGDPSILAGGPRKAGVLFGYRDRSLDGNDSPFWYSYFVVEIDQTTQQITLRFEASTADTAEQAPDVIVGSPVVFSYGVVNLFNTWCRLVLQFTPVAPSEEASLPLVSGRLFTLGGNGLDESFQWLTADMPAANSLDTTHVFRPPSAALGTDGPFGIYGGQGVTNFGAVTLCQLTRHGNGYKGGLPV